MSVYFVMRRRNQTFGLDRMLLAVVMCTDNDKEPNTLPPRASTQTSIPSLLVSLQSEYDAIMLESFTIKKAYTASRYVASHSTRISLTSRSQELANTLYREDAATRVIARLIKERDEARECVTHNPPVIH